MNIIILTIVLTLLVVAVLYLLWSNADKTKTLESMNESHSLVRESFYEWQRRVQQLEEKIRTQP